jgi:tetratricopeptide (TPR) repeat protein
MDLGRNMEAIAVLEHALSIAERNKESLPEMKKHIKFILNNAGIAQTDVGNYDVALDLLMRSLAIRQEEGDKKSLASAFNNIGRVYHELRSHTEAIKYYKQAIEVKRELGDKNGLERILINLGLSHDNVLEHEKAISYFNQALDVCGGQCSDETKKELYLATGRSHLLVHKLATAEEYLLKALAVSRKQNSPSYIINCLYQLSFVEDERGNIEERKRYLEQALALAESVDLVDLNIQINAEMANLYGEIGDKEKQVYHLSKYVELANSVYNNELLTNITKVQTKFDEREKTKALIALDKKLELTRQLMNKQRNQFIAIVIVTLFAITLSILLLRYRKKEAQVKKILY